MKGVIEENESHHRGVGFLGENLSSSLPKKLSGVAVVGLCTILDMDCFQEEVSS